MASSRSDFFGVEAYPEMTFTSTSIEQVDEETFRNMLVADKVQLALDVSAVRQA